MMKRYLFGILCAALVAGLSTIHAAWAQAPAKQSVLRVAMTVADSPLTEHSAVARTTPPVALDLSQRLSRCVRP